MPTFIVLLRGVNVGKAKRLAMAEWRAQLEAFGYRDVRTLLHSGNAVFRAGKGSSATHAARIENGLHERFGLQIPVAVVPATQLAAAVAENPLAASGLNPSHLLVVFALPGTDLDALEAVRPLLHGDESLHIGAHAAFLHCAGGILQSKAAESLLGKPKSAVTTRNWATTLKLHDLASQPAND